MQEEPVFLQGRYRTGSPIPLERFASHFQTVTISTCSKSFELGPAPYETHCRACPLPDASKILCLDTLVGFKGSYSMDFQSSIISVNFCQSSSCVAIIMAFCWHSCYLPSGILIFHYNMTLSLGVPSSYLMVRFHFLIIWQFLYTVSPWCFNTLCLLCFYRNICMPMEYDWCLHYIRYHNTKCTVRANVIYSMPHASGDICVFWWTISALMSWDHILTYPRLRWFCLGEKIFAACSWNSCSILKVKYRPFVRHYFCQPGPLSGSK